MVTINSAESNRTSIRYIAEATWGATPGSGTTRAMRITSSSLVASKETQVSEEIRADRMVPSVIEVSAMSSGSIEGEFSAGSYDEIFQSLVLGTWTRSMNHLIVKGAAVAVTGASQVTISGADYTDYLDDDQYLKLEGFLNAANNGYVRINGAPSYTGGNTVIAVDESSLVVEAGSAYTKVLDANDVILKSTLTAFTSGNTINGGGSNAFAGQSLFVGQTIYVEGLGKETGSITAQATDPTAGDTFSISDGVDTITYEIEAALASVAAGNVWVKLSNDPGVLSVKIHNAINGQFREQKCRVSATYTGGTKETGSFAFGTTAEVGDQLTVSDGEVSATFTFVASGGSGLTVSIGASANDSAANLAAAINAYTALNVTAAAVTDTCTITNDNWTGGTLTEDVDTGTDITTTNFSSGVVPTVALTNHRLTGGAITESLSTINSVAFAGGSATKGGFYTIASLPDDDTIVVAETLTADANGGTLAVVIKGAHLRNPGVISAITRRSFTFETGFTDVSKYFVMTGMRSGNFSISVEAGSLVSLSFEFMGRATSTHSSSVLGDGGTYTVLDAPATEVMNATANVGSVKKNGVVLTTAVRSIELNGEANLREQPAVGEKFPAGIGYGRFLLNGALTAYFETFDFYNDFINHTTVSLAFDFEDVDHFKYIFTVPAIKITSDPISPGGIDEDIMEEMEFTAQRDPVLNTQFMMDRFSSVWPASAVA